MAPAQSLLDPAWLRRQLLGWYRRHRRELPWRAPPGEPTDAYRVWISEVMLQQTRVAAVIPYYERFLRRFPDARALARAQLDEVLAAWSGLGYYRRARQLHAAARIVVDRYGGAFPMDEQQARALPGVGEYTVGAVLSIAGGCAHPAVDGNALRIARRLTGSEISLVEARALWTAWLAPRCAGEFNQAVMDLGATICTPRLPGCGVCPVRTGCRSRGKPAPPHPRRLTRAVEEHYGWLRRGATVWLQQRPAHARQMPGLWELPPARPQDRGAMLLRLRHTITDARITAFVHEIRRPDGSGRQSMRWMSRRQALAAPLSGLTRKILLRLWR